MPFSSRSHAAWCVALALLSANLPGCGYTTRELFPQQYQTVAAPIFDNQTFYKGVEFDLAEALSKQIESRTPYKLADSAKADTMLKGKITRIDQQQVTRTRQANLPEIMQISVTVNFEWEDLRTGKTILDRKGFTAVGQYIPPRPVSQPFETAQHGAVERLAEDMVDTMRKGWSTDDR